MKFRVVGSKWFVQDIEAESEDEALDLFDDYMREENNDYCDEAEVVGMVDEYGNLTE